MNRTTTMSGLLRTALMLLAVAAAPPVQAADTKSSSDDTFTHSEVLAQAEKLFGKGAKGLAEAIQKAFDDYGQPNAIIRGEEGSGAIGVGVRYGKGVLVTKGGGTRQVWWQGPSIGFDVGGNASKCFTLVYNLRNTERLFQRFPGVEGSLYLVGGFSLNYNRT
ncbi:MAG TPA: EipA family protein, partial [Steroidobacteraceae bacterium]|nr:EipA family protein [Steroidobacteraceae bacterium]